MCIDELGQIQVPSIQCRHDGETYYNQIIILLRYNVCNLIMIFFFFEFHIGNICPLFFTFELFNIVFLGDNAISVNLKQS
jgi:hypothetical protein